MSAKQFIIATAGHVDHGKSSLVKALTGIDPDRLPEEKARGITIDLGFAHLELPAPQDTSQLEVPTPKVETFHLGIVDVPGHEDFVKNMVAGVGSIDLALLVVAADDGWMPQTEEHLQILTYLGVKRGVVALTKIDLVENEEAAAASVREQLQQTPLADSPIVKTSVANGRGLEELKTALAQVLAGTPPPRNIGKPRLPVDRVFTLRGIGTVITGTLTGGLLNRGQGVVIQPSGQTSRIRSIQSHNREVESSAAGMRTALNLPDISVSGKSTHGGDGEGVRRGDVITLAELGTATDTFDALLVKSGRLADAKAGAARPLKEGTVIRVHLGSGSWPARVYLLDRKEIGPGEQGFGQLRFEAPVYAFLGDHFIVRDWAEQATLAGGVVLDADANRKNFRSPRQRKYLERTAKSLHEVDACIEAALERDGATSPSNLLLKSGFSVQEIQQSLVRLAAQAKAFLAGNVAASAAWWDALRQRAMGAIVEEHRAHPERGGLSLNGLRAAVEKETLSAEIFEALLAELGKTGFVQTGAAIRQASHRPALPPNLQAAGNKLRASLALKPLEPPSRKELAPDAVSQQALRFLLETGEAIELGPELVLLRENFDRAVIAIKKLLREHGSATVSELRQALATSRRIMLPILERLDRDGVTIRQEDRRTLK